MSLSFDPELREAIRSAAAAGNQSVSAWLAEAARDRLRLEALSEAISAWEQKFPPLTDAEMADADHLLGRHGAAKKPARGRRGGS